VFWKTGQKRSLFSIAVQRCMVRDSPTTSSTFSLRLLNESTSSQSTSSRTRAQICTLGVSQPLSFVNSLLNFCPLTKFVSKCETVRPLITLSSTNFLTAIVLHPCRFLHWISTKKFLPKFSSESNLLPVLLLVASSTRTLTLPHLARLSRWL
jgi:hypothetical protein